MRGDGRTLTKRVVKIPRQEAILISNESRKIHRGAARTDVQPTGGRKVNVSNSRREEPPKRGRAPREPKEPREKAKHPILRALGRTLATLICLGVMVCSLAAVAAVYYAVQATANDGNLLDLDNIELSQSSTVVATDPDTGAQVEYATLRSSNSHRVWADLEQIPTNLQYAFICTEDKDFYNEPGVNFKRTIGAMVNEYLLPIYIDELLHADKVSVKVLPTHDKWFGVTYAEDKQIVIDSFAKLVADGVYEKDLFSDLKK